MERKSVVFVSYSMGIGGVEKALLGVVNKFVREGWDVSLALIKKEGEFLKYLPAGVKITEIEGFSEIKPLIHKPMRDTAMQLLKRGKLFSGLYVAICLVYSKITGGARMLYDYAFRKIPKFSDRTFDLAVAFAGPDAFIDTYVDRCVRAKEKWGWIHFDITKFGIDKSIIRSVYRHYSKINIVSQDGKVKFDSLFPQFSNKTCVTPNVVDNKSIIQLASQQINTPFSKEKKNILTVGRISKEKGQFVALNALKILVERGFRNICWSFVGYGSDFERCKSYVRNNGLEEYVKFIGSKTNPYPYMSECDIYVQPSEHEGFCITLAEAKIFGKPIVATGFTGAEEQLRDYDFPWHISEYNPVSIAEKIQLFL